MPDLDTHAIAARKDAVMLRLETLHGARGAATLDGKSFDNRQIAQAEAELAALGEAEAEAVRRRRTAAAVADGARCAALRRRIEEVEAQRLEAVARAEQACRAMIDAMAQVMTASGEIRAAARAMGGRSPFALAADDVEARLADRLTVLLGTVAARPGWFGRLALRRPFFQAPTDDWRDAERRVAAADLAALTTADDGGA